MNTLPSEMHKTTPAEKKRKKDLKAFALIGLFFVVGLMVIFRGFSPDKRDNVEQERIAKREKAPSKGKEAKKAEPYSTKEKTSGITSTEDESSTNEVSPNVQKKETTSTQPKLKQETTNPKVVVPEKLYAYLGDPSATQTQRSRGGGELSFKYHLIGAALSTKKSAEIYAVKVRRKGGNAIVLLPSETKSTSYRVSIYQSNLKAEVTKQGEYLKQYDIDSFPMSINK